MPSAGFSALTGVPMNVRIETYNAHHLDAVIRLSLRAWTPVFESIQNVVDAEVYQAFYPGYWRVSQQKAVEDVCATEDIYVWVAISAEQNFERTDTVSTVSTVGFLTVKLYSEDSMGKIYMVAVDPDFQGQGIGTALSEFALAWMKEAKMSIAMVETGGDPGHAPARHTYEKLGFGLWTVARYFKKL